MKKDLQILTLDRSDLFDRRKNKPFNDIVIHDFKISYYKLIEYDIVLFIDNNGRVKVLKDRFNIFMDDKKEKCESNKLDSVKNKMDILLKRGLKFEFINHNMGIPGPTDPNIIYIRSNMSIDFIDEYLEQYLKNYFYELKEYVKSKIHTARGPITG